MATNAWCLEETRANLLHIINFRTPRSFNHFVTDMQLIGVFKQPLKAVSVEHLPEGLPDFNYK